MILLHYNRGIHQKPNQTTKCKDTMQTWIRHNNKTTLCMLDGAFDVTNLMYFET